MQYRRLHQDHRSEADVEIKSNERELLELEHGALVQRGFRGGLGYHDDLLSRPSGYETVYSQRAELIYCRAIAMRIASSGETR
jgi:hypothetical protein